MLLFTSDYKIVERDGWVDGWMDGWMGGWMDAIKLL
jgi:hypothetical protein